MQFPNPSLSDILKPLSDAIFLSPNDRSILLLTLLASSCIWWSSWMIRSREPKKYKVFINVTAWKLTILNLASETFRVKRKRASAVFSNNSALKRKLWLSNKLLFSFNFCQWMNTPIIKRRRSREEKLMTRSTLWYICVTGKRNPGKKVQASKIIWHISSTVWIRDYFNIV